MTFRPWSSVTTERDILVGRSVVSAMTHTPASGPFAPVTTPPISSSSIATAAVCALSCAGAAARNPNTPIAATLRHNLCFVVIFRSRFPLCTCEGDPPLDIACGHRHWPKLQAFQPHHDRVGNPPRESLARVSVAPAHTEWKQHGGPAGFTGAAQRGHYPGGLMHRSRLHFYMTME